MGMELTGGALDDKGNRLAAGCFIGRLLHCNRCHGCQAAEYCVLGHSPLVLSACSAAQPAPPAACMAGVLKGSALTGPDLPRACNAVVAMAIYGHYETSISPLALMLVMMVANG